MLNTIVAHNSQSWQAYFDRDSAIRAVFAHCASLPSARTPENHTARVYSAGLKYYLDLHADDLPTPLLIQSYIAHLVQRGLSSSTISSKYLAPLRHYLTALADQIDPTAPVAVYGMAHQITLASKIKAPRPETTSNVSALWRVGKRATITQVRDTLTLIPRHTLRGLRDYAFLMTAFSSALRISELGRITPSSITPSGDGVWLITVRGKRNNIDPVPISAQVKNAIDAYIQAYNTISPTPLADDTPLWQAIRGDNNPQPSARGMSHQALTDLIAKWTELGMGDRLAPHDLRRSAAAIAHDTGMDLKHISSLLRHKSLATTAIYIGDRPTYANRVMPPL